MKSDQKQFFKQVRALGWTIEDSAKSYKLRSPKGSFMTCSRTPSDTNAVRQMERDFKRILKKEAS